MSKPIMAGIEREWKKGDIVQITNEAHHWYPALIVVSEPKSFGVQGYFVVVDNTDKGNGMAFIRLNHDDIELVGAAVIVHENHAEEV